MSLNFGGINIGGNSGGGGTVDGFLPAGTIINVKTDGTGDFTTLASVINYLKGKWSNGAVNIQIGSGTFNETTAFSIDTIDFNIPVIKIVGDGVGNTTLNYSGSSTPMVIMGNGVVIIRHFTLNCTGTNYTCISCSARSNVKMDNITVVGTNKTQTNGIGTYRNNTLELGDYITIKNVKNAITADQSGRVTAGDMSHSEFNNCDYGWNISNGSIITGIASTTPTYTSVTNKVSQTPATLSNSGFIANIPV